MRSAIFVASLIIANAIYPEGQYSILAILGLIGMFLIFFSMDLHEPKDKQK